MGVTDRSITRTRGCPTLRQVINCVLLKCPLTKQSPTIYRAESHKKCNYHLGLLFFLAYCITYNMLYVMLYLVAWQANDLSWMLDGAMFCKASIFNKQIKSAHLSYLKLWSHYKGLKSRYTHLLSVLCLLVFPNSVVALTHFQVFMNSDFKLKIYNRRMWGEFRHNILFVVYIKSKSNWVILLNQM